MAGCILRPRPALPCTRARVASIDRHGHHACEVVRERRRMAQSSPAPLARAGGETDVPSGKRPAGAGLARSMPQ
ncbi:hypothetical protein [Oryza sativa Japonica Group]|uniref:Uncharacterized protein n=1 Tax=Oryza sativa subsp. japonica TaxID=39947 RepID=Q8S0T0_ORYSJ|nr:hypothetical protein [Oryza sativa Japonica Group]